MKAEKSFLVLGATGSIGFAVTNELLKKGEAVTILVRNHQKAVHLFGNHQNLKVIVGDAQESDTLNNAARGKNFIFHGINYPYPKWDPLMIRVTENVIRAATINHATIVFPGNIYNFGHTTFSITETTAENPHTKKGKLRVMLEKNLNDAAMEGKCKVLVVRLPDFWGPNVTNEGIAPIFVNALKKKALPFIVRTDIPHQFVYTPDAARVIYRLINETENHKPFEVFNYGGTLVPSVNYLLQIISQQAGAPFKTKIYSKSLLKIVALFMPMMKELMEMLYLYENTLVLDDSKLKNQFPDFTETPLDAAAKETLEWFRKWKDKKS